MLKGWIAAALLLLAAPAAVAVEVASRISDREIIESLAELKAGQRVLEEKMEQRFAVVDQRFVAIDQRFVAIDQRFVAIDQRFEAIDQRFVAIDQRFDAIDQRFDAIDKRFEYMGEAFDRRFAFIESLMMVTIAGIFGLIGYIVWDRKTALRPVEERLIRLESEFHRDLEIQHEEGSRLTRLVKVLREMAKDDEKLAGVLRGFSLL